MPAASSTSPPVARLSTPGEIASVVPVLCGFVPHESLVVVSLQRRSRVGLTMRVDLPPPAVGADLAVSLAERLRLDRARRALLVVYTDAPDDDCSLPGADLVHQLAAALDDAGIPTTDQLLVRRGRWWSYACDVPSCCPREGTPLDAESTPALGLVAARSALGGRAVLPSRADLVASLAAPPDDAVRERLDEAERDRLHRVATQGRVAVGRDALRLWRRALDRLADHGDLGAQTSAALVVSLADVLVRDEVLSWVLKDDDDQLLALLLNLAAGCTAPFDVPVCSLVAWTAHARGNGALANVALDRALAGDPGYGLAGLCRQALDAQVAPAAVRALLVDARTLLRQQHPWTGCHES
jgi:hypothetical protein